MLCRFYGILICNSVMLLSSVRSSLTSSRRPYAVNGSKPTSGNRPHLLRQHAASGDTGGQVGDGGERKNRNTRCGKRSDLHSPRKQRQTESSTGKD